MGHERCSGAGEFKEDARIRPFLKSRETRDKQDDAPKHLPQSENSEKIQRIPQVRNYIGDERACYNRCSAMREICDATCQSLKGDEYRGHPITGLPHLRSNVCSSFL